MSKKTMRLWSVLLVFVMIFNMLPLNAMALEAGQKVNSNTASRAADDTYIVGEVIENRTEYTKEFVMSNGFHLAAVYDNAVHYQENGQWKEIDNTLKLASTRSGNVYTNTAGGWQVVFPQSLTSANGVTISRDEYVLSFRMTGELHKSTGGVVVMEADTNAEQYSEEEADILNILSTDESLSLSQPADSTDALVHTIDCEDEYADAQYVETVVDTLHSKLEYTDVYDNTDLIFELMSNLVKESIVINQFDDTLYGYTYLLDVGEMIPVLTESGEIELYDANLENVVMLMPAPYLVDNAGECNYDVQVMLDEMDGRYVLSYILPQAWIADNSREWPLVLDPIVYATAEINNVRDIAVYSKTYLGYQNGILQCGNFADWGTGRIYLKYNQLPILSPSDVIVAANVSLITSTTSIVSPRTVEVHKVTDTWASETITWNNKPEAIDTVEDFQICETTRTCYTWDITDIARGWYDGENTGMMFKVDDASEASTSNTRVQFWSSDYDQQNIPTVLIMFRNNNGLEGYWDYTSSSAGRAGTGYVNQYSGNLVWTHSDIGFGGNKMPVSISHIYNSNDCMDYYQFDEDDEDDEPVLVRAANPFGMGNGWRTNFNQQVKRWQNPNAYGDYYVWEDADGTSHYFYYDTQEEIYKDEDGMELTLTVASSGYTITDKNGNTSEFDSNGRLHKQVNNQETPSYIEVTYNSSGFIETIKDGAGRVYTFHYQNSLLSKISYQGTEYISFVYDGSNLKTITDNDGKSCQYEYTENNLLCTAIDVDDYKIAYTYVMEETGKPSRVATIKEYSKNTKADTPEYILGGTLSITYGQNETTFIDHNGNTQTVQFNNWGNTIAIQDDQGRAQYAQYAINEPAKPETEADTQTTAETEPEADTDNTAKGNQLRIASKMQNTVSNLLDNSSFESGSAWLATHSEKVNCSVDTTNAYFGSQSLKVTNSDDSIQAGAYGASFSVNPGETYTFSAYVKTEETVARLAIGAGSSYVYSDYHDETPGWIRLEVNYTNESDTVREVHPLVLTKDRGTVWIDCIQLEKFPTASRYNLIEDGDFRNTTHWSESAGRITQEITAAPVLSSDVYKMEGNPTAINRISQTVRVSGADGEVFVLAGWAMGESVPLDENREFSLIATFNYTDGSTSKSTIRFNPCVDSWQYAAAPIVAEKAYSSILIEVAYDYNANTAYFDGIQLFKEAFGSSYTYDENGNVTAVKDIHGGETIYSYEEDGDLSSVTLPDGSITSYEYDKYHNVTKATTNTGVVYDLTYDDYGNNTSVTITSDGISLTSSASYAEAGNILKSTTDTAGNTTVYGYNPTTNVLEWVQYPNDTPRTEAQVATETSEAVEEAPGTCVHYSYDAMFRLVSSVVTTNQGKTLSASYTYENDLLTKLATQSTEYTFEYGLFSRIESIKAGQRELASYTYTNDQNNYLAALEYGNEDKVEYTYDSQGRVVAQTWEGDATVTYKYDNSGALATVTDSATGRTTTYYYDFTDRLMKYVEKGSSFSHSVGYEYDTLNNLTKLVNTINDSVLTTAYTYDDDKRIETLMNTLLVGEEEVVSASATYTYDAFGRLGGKSTSVGENSVVSVAYTYRSDTATNTTTGQVDTLTISTNTSDYGKVYTYKYDGNGNITEISDGTNTTKYHYDTLNQLIREDNQAANKTWVWTYDNAGNILAKTEYAYTNPQTNPNGHCTTVVYDYDDDDDWGDLLTDISTIVYDADGNAVKTLNADSITYDTIGNPDEVKNSAGEVILKYTWEHGRQLAGLHGIDMNGGENDVTVSYTYNADGIRTGKTVTTKVYTSHDHSYSNTVVEPTCEDAGYTLHECSCGDSYQDTETEALGHSYTTTIVDPTETTPGYTQYTCTRCGYTYSNHTHSYTASQVVEPTCTRQGYTLYTCLCGAQSKQNYVAALGHDFTNRLGMATNTCQRCGYKRGDYELPVPPIGPPIDNEIMGGGEGENVTGSEGIMNVSATDERTLESTIVTQYEYIYTGTQLTQMIVTTTVDDETPTTETLYFAYEASGPMTVTYNGTTYYYAANLQGDIIAILKADGEAVVEYAYDAWGKILDTTIEDGFEMLAEHNPLRYRGYVYDTETTLYYLQSRYYDPELGRFINADAYASTGQGILGNNMFAYCGNNPVIHVDSTGTRIVGVGVQFEIQANGVSIGVEVIIYFDSEVCDGSDFMIVSYQYAGYDLSATQMENILNQIDWAMLITTIEGSGQAFSDGSFDTHFLYTCKALMEECLSGVNVSGAFFTVDGFSNFDSPDDYSGEFRSLSLSGTLRGKTVSGYYSFSPTCQAFGVKVGLSIPGFDLRAITSKTIQMVCFDASYSKTYYSDPKVWYVGDFS